MTGGGEKISYFMEVEDKVESIVTEPQEEKKKGSCLNTFKVLLPIIGICAFVLITHFCIVMAFSFGQYTILEGIIVTLTSNTGVICFIGFIGILLTILTLKLYIKIKE